jgi:hypothetical protein
MSEPPKSLDFKEAYHFLENLFPQGLQDKSLMEELCPKGWENSPLRLAFHPTIEQQYQEHLGFSERLKWLKKLGRDKRKEDYNPTPVETFEEFKAKDGSLDKNEILSHENEFAELLGLCLWDVFSDNHDVISSEKLAVDLGSFRGAAGTISDFMAQHSWTEDTDPCDRGDGYLEFYLGTAHVGGRTPLTPVYEHIFRRLKSLGADWNYSFPRMHAFKFAKPDAPETDYAPSEALQKGQDKKAEARQMSKLNRELDQSALAAKREIRSQPPPETVAAYQKIYGCFPVGWPPDPYDPS